MLNEQNSPRAANAGPLDQRSHVPVIISSLQPHPDSDKYSDWPYSFAINGNLFVFTVDGLIIPLETFDEIDVSADITGASNDLYIAASVYRLARPLVVELHCGAGTLQDEPDGLAYLQRMADGYKKNILVCSSAALVNDYGVQDVEIDCPYTFSEQLVFLAEAGNSIREYDLYVAEHEAQYRERYGGFVYLVQSSTGAYKIGRTKDPQDRMRTFTVKLPFEVEYAHLIPARNMYEAEEHLHLKFAAKRVNGEWFRLDPDDVAYIKGIEQL